ncbi:MAG TPA: tetratricopeptide repeat protein [Flavisolibacter sp.]
MAEALHPEENILRYLDGEMPDAEKRDFENQMQADEVLRQQVQDMALAIEAVRHAGTVATVRSVHADMMKELPGKKPASVVPFGRVVRYTMAAAASVLLIFTMVQGYLFYRLDAEEVYGDAFVNYEVSATRGAATTETPVASAYSRRKYNEVIAQAGQATDARDSFLVALAYIDGKQPDRAIPLLAAIHAQKHSTLAADAQFYLGMAWLQKKDYDKSLAYLRPIYEDDEHLYHDHVPRRLIRKLKMLQWKN